VLHAFGSAVRSSIFSGMALQEQLRDSRGGAEVAVDLERRVIVRTGSAERICGQRQKVFVSLMAVGEAAVSGALTYARERQSGPRLHHRV